MNTTLLLSGNEFGAGNVDNSHETSLRRKEMYGQLEATIIKRIEFPRISSSHSMYSPLLAHTRRGLARRKMFSKKNLFHSDEVGFGIFFARRPIGVKSGCKAWTISYPGIVSGSLHPFKNQKPESAALTLPSEESIHVLNECVSLSWSRKLGKG